MLVWQPSDADAADVTARHVADGADDGGLLGGLREDKTVVWVSEMGKYT